MTGEDLVFFYAVKTRLPGSVDAGLLNVVISFKCLSVLGYYVRLADIFFPFSLTFILKIFE